LNLHSCFNFAPCHLFHLLEWFSLLFLGLCLAITISPDSCWWVICAIWINGSEFEPLRVWFVNLTHPADEKVRCHFGQRRGTCVWRCIRQLIMLVQSGNLDFNSRLKQQMRVLEERLAYLFAVFCKDLLCSCFHFGSRTFICMFNIFVFPPPLT
jgi:hypothetical protein